MEMGPGRWVGPDHKAWSVPPKQDKTTGMWIKELGGSDIIWYEFLKGNYGYTDGQEKGDMGKKYRNHWGRSEQVAVCMERWELGRGEMAGHARRCGGPRAVVVVGGDEGQREKRASGTTLRSLGGERCHIDCIVICYITCNLIPGMGSAHNKHLLNEWMSYTMSSTGSDRQLKWTWHFCVRVLTQLKWEVSRLHITLSQSSLQQLHGLALALGAQEKAIPNTILQRKPRQLLVALETRHTSRLYSPTPRKSVHMWLSDR